MLLDVLGSRGICDFLFALHLTWFVRILQLREMIATRPGGELESGLGLRDLDNKTRLLIHSKYGVFFEIPFRGGLMALGNGCAKLSR